jgi:uncharacterized membrane protein YgcG
MKPSGNENRRRRLAHVIEANCPQSNARQGKACRTIWLVVVLVVSLEGSSCFRKSKTEPSADHVIPAATPQRTLPKQTGLINDFAEVFDATEEERLNQLVSELREVDIDFPIVTIDTTKGETLFDYSLALARDWHPGGPNKRGLLLVLAIKDRQWRLQVSEALRSVLPDEVCLALGRPSEEFYKQGKYANGVEHYVRALGERLRKVNATTVRSQ